MAGLPKHTRLLTAAILTVVMLTGCREDIPDLPPMPPPDSQTEIPTLEYTVNDLPPSPQAPHNGRLLTIDNRMGYVEWICKNGQATVYFLDTAGNPLTGVSKAVLQIATPGGPKILKFANCQDKDSVNACTTVSDIVLEQDPPAGVIRFVLNDEGYRVLLPSLKPVTQPAGTRPTDLRAQLR